MTKKRAAVFISAGLGDAILLIPLIKRLKNDNYIVLGVITTVAPCEKIFEGTGLLDEVILVKNDTIKLVRILFSDKKCDVSFLNQFAGGRKDFLLAKKISKQIVTNCKHSLMGLGGNSLIYKAPVFNVHDAVQNMLLYSQELHDLNETDFLLNTEDLNCSLTLPQNYIVIQLGTGNGKAPYKTWPIKYWEAFIEFFKKEFPLFEIVLLGDLNEIYFANNISFDKVHSFVGKTSLLEAKYILKNSFCFVGLDGGLMHLCVTVGAPTFTIWGASDPDLYAYNKIAPDRHRLIRNVLTCQPCNSWIRPNITKTNNPLDCPDFACLTSLLPEKVFKEFCKFILDLASNEK